jgi:hypothetical protein
VPTLPFAVAGIGALAAAAIGSLTISHSAPSALSGIPSAATAQFVPGSDTRSANAVSRSVDRGAILPAAQRPESHQPASAPATAPAKAHIAFGLPAANPRTPAQAIAWARKAVHGHRIWFDLCLRFVAVSYGYNHSGSATAMDHWRETPAKFRHPGDKHPPRGALLYWTTGHYPGHVAIYVGKGLIASNDIKRRGAIDIVPMSKIAQKWGARYVGWAAPYFPKGEKL